MTRILVIDDEAVIRLLMAEILQAAGYDVVEAETAEQALTLLDREEFDLVVSDVVMPGLSGLQLIEATRPRHASLPIVLVTGAGTYDTLSQALTRGAAGLVTKPFAHADLQNAVADAVERAERSREALREKLLTPTLASALANAIEAREPSMQGHCERLAALAVRLAEELRLPWDEIETVRLGAILHDVGKIGIPDRVLLKPGPLADEERTIMRTHPLIGDRLLEPLDLLAGARPIVRHHHERWDGGGYPDGLAGEEIPLGARIVAVADAVEVMSGRQLYSSPRTPPEVVAELRRCRGGQWDPFVVDATLGLIEAGEVELTREGLRLAERQTDTGAGEPLAVLVVLSAEHDATLVANRLEQTVDGAVVARAGTVAQAEELVRSSAWSLAVVDELLPDGSGMQLLDRLRSLHPSTPVLLITDGMTPAGAVEAFAHGLSDYVVRGDGYLDALAERARWLVAA